MASIATADATRPGDDQVGEEGQSKRQFPDVWSASQTAAISRNKNDCLLMASTDAQELVQKPEVRCNERVDDWTDRPIGRGAFGQVWSVVDPRNGGRLALKRMTNIFSSLQLAKRVYREVTCLCFLHHDNILSSVDIIQPASIEGFHDIFILTPLMDSDLYRIIGSKQPISKAHIKVFLYQILRGLKYLHSGKIIHRDVKPANLLVNINCCLKICDFGLVREDDATSLMTQDVSTQYYRSPEMLMGARNYSAAVDVWATGCVFAELLSRRILFQCNSPIQQLDLITEVVGTPGIDDMRFACEAARQHILRQTRNRQGIQTEVNSYHQILYFLSSPELCTEDAIQLLRQLLVFNPEKRLTASKALLSSYLKQGRDLYHSSICSCHPNRHGHAQQDLSLNGTEDGYPSPDLEPAMEGALSFQCCIEDEALTLTDIQSALHQTCLDNQRDQCNPLRINTESASYKQSVA